MYLTIWNIWVNEKKYVKRVFKSLIKFVVFLRVSYFIAFYKQSTDHTIHWLLFRIWKNKSELGYEKRLVYYFQSINQKVPITQIMTPYSLTSVVNHSSSSCQDISNHNPGTKSVAWKQDNSQALKSRLDYNWINNINP
jgi:hypothetical protein